MAGGETRPDGCRLTAPRFVGPFCRKDSTREPRSRTEQPPGLEIAEQADAQAAHSEIGQHLRVVCPQAACRVSSVLLRGPSWPPC
jgi:hypothetical protein